MSLSERPPLALSTQPPVVLFLCRRNTSVSIMAEAILRHFARQRVRAASGGESIAGPVNSHALECLRVHGIGTEGLASKPWGRFFGLDKPPVRLIIALSDVYGAKADWRPYTLVANWPMPDPADVVGSEVDIQLAFEEVYGTLLARIQRLLPLPLAQMDNTTLSQELERISRGT